MSRPAVTETLDEAWAEMESALPPTWVMDGLIPYSQTDPWLARAKTTRDHCPTCGRGRTEYEHGFGRTPAEALVELARRFVLGLAR